jgi:hypothetical protein
MTGARPAAGLCAECAEARRVESARGATFWLCRRSDRDPAFPRYPRLPVLRCAGFTAGPDTTTRAPAGRAGEETTT